MNFPRMTRSVRIALELLPSWAPGIHTEHGYHAYKGHKSTILFVLAVTGQQLWPMYGVTLTDDSNVPSRSCPMNHQWNSLTCPGFHM